MSYNIGSSVISRSTPTPMSTGSKYTDGYYDGGARLIATLDHSGQVFQPAPLTDTSTGLVDAGNWAVTDTWNCPSSGFSGQLSV